MTNLIIYASFSFIFLALASFLYFKTFAITRRSEDLLNRNLKSSENIKLIIELNNSNFQLLKELENQKRENEQLKQQLEEALS